MGRLTSPANVRRQPLLDASGCAAVLGGVDARRDEWMARGDHFYTLGAACYLDLCGETCDWASYAERAKRGNAVMLDHFSDLLEGLRGALQGLLSERCYFGSDLALPGFHIFLARSLNASMRDNLHLDLQYSYLPSAPPLDTQTVTFTLPLQTPAAGAGIEFCVPREGVKRGQLVVECYRDGELLVHSGRTLHRRAHFSTTERCRRITLQGHGIRRANGWELYW